MIYHNVLKIIEGATSIGISHDNDQLYIRKIVMLNSISIIGIIIIICFGTLAFYQSIPALGFIDYIADVLLSGNLIYLRNTGNYKAASFLGCFFAATFFFYLFVSGGAFNTGPIWYYTFPLISCYLLGSRQGAIASLLLISMSILFLIINKFIGPFSGYPKNFLLRFIPSFFVVFAYALLYQNMMEKDQEKLTSANELLEKKVKERTTELRTANEKLNVKIDEYKQAQRAIEASHERFETVLNSISADVYVADMNTHEILFMNKNMRDSYKGDFTGQKCWIKFRNETEPCIHCPNVHLIDSKGNPTGVYKWEIYNPKIKKWCLNYDRAIRWVDNRIVKLQIATDITEFKKMEEERVQYEENLRQSHKMESIGILAGGLAHDFNNILGIILINTEVAIDDVPELNQAKYNLEEIRTASLRAKDVVRQLLSFARKTKLEKKPINIIPTVQESLKLLRSSIPTSIEIRQDIQAKDDTIMADPTQIHQIVMNLCTNASHAMETRGTIEVKIENIVLDEDSAALYTDMTPDNYVQVTVSDTGQGIAPEAIDLIFDPYFTTKEVGKGTGMGLSVVHGIVKSHGGAILVESELGKGTTISVLFPVIEKQADLEIETDEELPTGNERILFVDDEKSMVYVGRNKLERLGYKIEARTSPIEALELFRANPDQFDLVITDMTMPQMTGDHLAEEILKIRPDMPTILCTGFSEKIDEEKAKEIGIRQYIEKPFNMLDLAHLLRKVLDEK